MSNRVQSVKDLIKGAQRPRRAFRMNLRGDLRAKIELLDAELVDVRAAEKDRPSSAKRLTESSEAMTLATRIAELREEMADWWLELELEAKSYEEWETFKAKHPAREGNEADDNAGFNFDKLVFEFAPTCVVEPQLDSEDWENIFNKCAPADLRNFGLTAFVLHQTGADIPKSQAASVMMRLSDADSEPQETGESASGDSTDGSRPNSTSTSTQTGTSPEQPS